MKGTVWNEAEGRSTVATEADRLPDADVSGASVDEALRLAELSEPERRRYLKNHEDLCDPQVVIGFCRRAAGLLRMDLPLARRMVDAAGSVAEVLRDPVSSARSERARAQLHHIEADYSAALEHYAKSVGHYEVAGEEVQAAITRSCSLHVLALKGRFELAGEWAERSRELFTRMGDRVRLARLDANVAVVLHRQHDFEEALRLSLRAFERLRAQGTSQDVAVTLRNMLVCHVGLRNVAMALDTYERARTFADRHRFPRLVHEADYNIALVYQIQGDVEKAIHLYERARTRFREWGDPLHDALCDLDQSVAYLDLLEIDEAAGLSQKALAGFDRLGLEQEAGRALVHLAIVAGSRGQAADAQESLERARQRFTSCGDTIWCGLTEFYRSLVFELAGQSGQAIEVAGAARDALAKSPKVVRRALFDSLLGYLQARRDGSEEAQKSCRRAVESLVVAAGVPKMPAPGWLLPRAPTEPILSAALSEANV